MSQMPRVECHCPGHPQTLLATPNGRLYMRCDAPDCGIVRDITPPPPAKTAAVVMADRWRKVQRRERWQMAALVLWLVYGFALWFLLTLLVAVTIVPACALAGSAAVFCLAASGIVLIKTWINAWRSRFAAREWPLMDRRK